MGYAPPKNIQDFKLEVTSNNTFGLELLTSKDIHKLEVVDGKLRDLETCS